MFIEPSQLLGGMASLSGSRRARCLTDIIPQYGATKPGHLCSEGEVRSISGGGSVRIHHLTGVSPEGRSRFPKLEECAHFHYEHVELGELQILLCENEDLKPGCEGEPDSKHLTVKVISAGQSWLLRRTYDNFRMLDEQLHRCIYDRKFSNLKELQETPPLSQEETEKLLSSYLNRFSEIAGSLINCGPVLSWLELDNRGRRLLVTEGDNCPINTPAVAAAYSIKKYTAVAADEISFDVGDMISVIDMPPPEESAWWRGKRGFLVGFFPSHCVAVITDKLPRNLNLHQSLTLAGPTKPVLRKHGKLIAFFRAFILSRPSRRRLKQSGILKERVFGCDLGEHLLNSGHEIPMVLKCCSEFIETNGIVDGIYRLSGVTSNIQKLRRTFDEDRVPALYEDEAILQDIHSVASLLKMYFRELPNPLCTYQLYEAFVRAVQADKESNDRLLRMRETVEKLPPPHYRTLEYLMRHLARVSEKGSQTGMTARNVAIVWAPNLLRCKELEVGGVAALQGVGVQAVVTEFLIVYADLIFCSAPLPTLTAREAVTRKARPKSLAISTPTKLLSLEEAQSRALAAGKPDQDYIEVGGGPSCLPAKYHTVIELPRKRPGSKRSPLGWKSLFTKAGRHTGSLSSRKSRSPAVTPDQRKSSISSDIIFGHEKALTESDLTSGRRRLRPVKSAESLASTRSSGCLEPPSPPSPQVRLLQPPGHNRSVSHDSYFDTLIETPKHSQQQSHSQLLQEEDEEGLSLSLDLSELQVNFDLEESEMRIFSEDETNQLFSSHNSLETNLICKRQPLLARAEDSSSTDPSPKKHKTANSSSASSNRSKRSRLEERFSNAELRYIDSGSPEQRVQIQVEVHQSPTGSENESVTLSPDTPTPHLHYTPLTEDSLSDAVTTPEYHKLSPSPHDREDAHMVDEIVRYENLPSKLGSVFSNSSNLSEEVNYELIKESSVYESIDDAKKNVYANVPILLDDVSTPLDEDSELYEPVMRKDLDSSYEENVMRGYEELDMSRRECLLNEQLQCGGISSSWSEERHKSVEVDEHVYEDIQTVSMPDSLVYQQVKYLRRSVHEINQLLEESMEPFTGEDVSSLEEETALISPMNNRTPDSINSVCESHDKLSDHTLTVQSESVSNLLISENGTNKDILNDNSTVDDVEAISSSSYEEQDKCVDMLYDNSHSKSDKTDLSIKIDKNSVSDDGTDFCRSEIESIDVSRCVQSLDENKCKFESEIGRGIVRERKMKQDLEANSSSTGNNSGRNVQELLSRFEQEPLPPCLKARLCRQNSKDNAPTLTTSLDGSNFPCNSPQLPRVKTSPDLNQNQEEPVKENKTEENPDSEAVRRERIEKYKEERRNFLRKKYKTDSFNSNDDRDEEMIRRLKAKAGSNSMNSSFTGVSSDIEWTAKKSPLRRREDSDRRLSDDKPVKHSPSKTLVSISYSPTKTKATPNWESLVIRNSKSPELERLSDSVYDKNQADSSSERKLNRHRPDDLNLSSIVKNKSKEEAISPKFGSKLERRTWRVEGQIKEGVMDKSPDESLVARRVNQLTSSSSNDVSVRRRTSLTDYAKPTSVVRQRANSSSTVRSPSYCIRDMAAMFENRDVK